MQIPIFEGAYTDQRGDFRTSYPINLIATPKKTGLSEGYLRTAPGVKQFAAGTPGRDRGGKNWNGVLYRACGTSLCSVTATGAVTVLGDIGDDGNDAVFDYSFDRLAIASNGRLYYFKPGEGVTQNTDPDLGTVICVVFIDGYFCVTDGTTIAVTELNDPYSVNPLKYGSAEQSPDPIKRLLRFAGQLVAVGRLTCEFFQNIGGNLFPFQRISNALINRGAVGVYAVDLYNDTFAFVGSGENEPLSVYLAAPGSTTSIATQEIAQLLKEAGGEAALANMRVESRMDDKHQLLYLHLPAFTLVFDSHATEKLQTPIWFVLSSGIDGGLPYRARNWVFVYDRWTCGDLLSYQLGESTDDVTTQFGEKVPWRFDTVYAYNEGKGALIHELELVHNPGAAGADCVIWFQFSEDGRTFGQEIATETIEQGDTLKRAIWWNCGMMNSACVLRFRGVNSTPDAFARVNIEAEALAI